MAAFRLRERESCCCSAALFIVEEAKEEDGNAGAGAGAGGNEAPWHEEVFVCKPPLACLLSEARGKERICEGRNKG